MGIRQIRTADLSAGAATSIPSSGNLSFSSNTVLGNRVLIVVANVTQKTITLSGTNKRQECGSGNLGGAVFDTIADGTTMGFQATWTPSSRASMTIVEFDDAYTYDTSAENENNTGTVVTSQDAASSAPTADASATFGVAVFIGDLASNIDGGGTRNYTGSWAEQSWNSAASCPGIAIATKDITGGGSINTTFSVTDTGDEMYSVILSYIPPPAGSPGTAAGTSTAAAVGAADAAAAGAASGAGAAAGVGASDAAGAGAAAGVAGASGVGASIAEAAGAASGVGAAPGVGASIAEGVGVAAGVATADAVGEAAGGGSVGAAGGSSAATGVGASDAEGVGAAAGVSSAAAVGASVAEGVGSSGGTGTAVGVGTTPGAVEGAGSAAGTSTAAARAYVIVSATFTLAQRSAAVGVASRSGAVTLAQRTADISIAA